MDDASVRQSVKSSHVTHSLTASIIDPSLCCVCEYVCMHMSMYVYHDITHGASQPQF